MFRYREYMAKQSLASRVRQAVHANPTKTYGEIAQIVGCSVSTVTKHSPGRRSNSASGVASNAADPVVFEPEPSTRTPTKPVPLKRVASLLGKGVGPGNLCSLDAPMKIERNETGITYTLTFQPKNENSRSAEFFGRMQCLIQVRDTSSEATGPPDVRYTTLGEFKDNAVDGFSGVLRGGKHLQPDNIGAAWREPGDSRGLWKGNPPSFTDFAEMTEPLSVGFTSGSKAWDGDRPILRMASICGPKSRFNGRLVATDSYTLVNIRPPAAFAVNRASIPIQPIQKFVDMARSTKCADEPVDVSVGDYETFTGGGGPMARCPQTTTMSCGGVSVQVTLDDEYVPFVQNSTDVGDSRNYLNIGDVRNYPNVERLYPTDTTEVFEVPDPAKLAAWITSNKKKKMDGRAVFTAARGGEPSTVEVLHSPQEYDGNAGRPWSSDGDKQQAGISRDVTQWSTDTAPSHKIGFNADRLTNALSLVGKRSPVSISLAHDSAGGVSPLKPVVITSKTREPRVDILMMPERLPKD